MLCDALEEGATLEAVAAGLFVTFSHPWSVLEIENRWRAMLFSPTVCALLTLPALIIIFMFSIFMFQHTFLCMGMASPLKGR